MTTKCVQSQFKAGYQSANVERLAVVWKSTPSGIWTNGNKYDRIWSKGFQNPAWGKSEPLQSFWVSRLWYSELLYNCLYQDGNHVMMFRKNAASYLHELMRTDAAVQQFTTALEDETMTLEGHKVQQCDQTSFWPVDFPRHLRNRSPSRKVKLWTWSWPRPIEARKIQPVKDEKPWINL